MARIPDPSDVNRVAAQPSTRVASYRTGDVEMATARFGETVSKLAVQAHDDVQRTRAQEALNKLNQGTVDLALGEKGYTRDAGSAVVNVPEGGQPYVEARMQQFKDLRTEASKGLYGSALDVFNERAESAGLAHQSGLLRHSVAETEKYHNAIDAQTVKLGAETASGVWGDEKALAGITNDITQTVVRRAARQGVTDEGYVMGEIRNARAAVHNGAVLGALAAGQWQYAEDYISAAKNKADIPADDYMVLTEKINKLRSQQVNPIVVANIAKQFTRSLLPKPYDNAAALATNSPVFTASLKPFGGDVEKAWAASHSTPKAVQDAVARADKTAKLAAGDKTITPMGWLDFLPEATRKHVKSNRVAYESGAGPTPPTLLEIKSAAVANLMKINPKATATDAEAVQSKAEAWYNDVQSTKRQGEEQALTSIRQRASTGELTSFQDLTAEEKTALGDKISSAKTYIEAEQEDRLDKSPTAAAFYEEMYLNPKKLATTGLDVIYSHAKDLGKKRVDDLVTRRLKYREDPGSLNKATVDSNMFYAITRGLGLDGKTPDQKLRLAAMHNLVEFRARELNIGNDPEKMRALITKAVLDTMEP